MYSQMAKECLRNIFKEATILVPAWRRGITPLARQTSGTLRCSSFSLVVKTASGLNLAMEIRSMPSPQKERHALWYSYL